MHREEPIIVAKSGSRQQIVTNSRVNFILDDKMLQYVHVVMLLTSMAFNF